MSTRKKWRLKLYPHYTYEDQASMVRAYRTVCQLREEYAQGLSNTHQVNVEVKDPDEGDLWCTYEILVFPERAVGETS